MTVREQNDAILEELVWAAQGEYEAGDVAFEVATEELIAQFVADTSEIDSSLKFVSLKGQVGAWDANQGTSRKNLPPVAHYRGPTGSVSSGRVSPVAELVGSARYHMQMNWGGGARANGLQYHSAVWGDIVYLCRNPLAILWHAANASYNARAHGCQFPIGGTEITTATTRQTAKLWYDEINRVWGTKGLKGHKEVSQTGTSCPGRSMDDFVIPYRNGQSFGVKPAPSPVKPEPTKPTPAPAKTSYRVLADGKQQGVFDIKQNAVNLVAKLMDSHDDVRVERSGKA